MLSNCGGTPWNLLEGGEAEAINLVNCLRSFHDVVIHLRRKAKTNVARKQLSMETEYSQKDDKT